MTHYLDYKHADLVDLSVSPFGYCMYRDHSTMEVRDPDRCCEGWTGGILLMYVFTEELNGLLIFYIYSWTVSYKCV